MAFFDRGGKAAKFADPGDTITGTISRAYREVQATKFGTSIPDTWPNGDPKMQAVVDLDTTLREDANDDGARTLYVASSRMRKAIQDALRATNAPDLVKGGKLTVTFTSYGEGQNPANPPKEFTATYAPPSSLAFAQPVVPAAQPAPEMAMAGAPAVQPAPVATPAPAAGGMSKVEEAKALIAVGMTDEDVAAAVGLGAQAIAAIRNLP